jgi:protein transport protein SEC31
VSDNRSETLAGASSSTSAAESQKEEPDNATDTLIKEALMLGQFETAVDLCLKNDRTTDALLLAMWGDPEGQLGLYNRALRSFFMKQKRPFFKVLKNLMDNELPRLVQTSKTTNWRETLAIISCFAPTDQDFSDRCTQLGDLVATGDGNAPGNADAALLCYLCACNVERVIGIWLEKSRVAREKYGVRALQEVVEKCCIFRRATGATRLGSTAASIFSEYATMLASEGRLDVAEKITMEMDADGLETEIMRHRLYWAQPAPQTSQPTGK